MPTNFASYCDTELKWFETEAEAIAEANRQIEISRQESADYGWDEEVTDGIVVFQVVHRAEKISSNGYMDYRLSPVAKGGAT